MLDGPASIPLERRPQARPASAWPPAPPRLPSAESVGEGPTAAAKSLLPLPPKLPERTVDQGAAAEGKAKKEAPRPAWPPAPPRLAPPAVGVESVPAKWPPAPPRLTAPTTPTSVPEVAKVAPPAVGEKQRMTNAPWPPPPPRIGGGVSETRPPAKTQAEVVPTIGANNGPSAVERPPANAAPKRKLHWAPPPPPRLQAAVAAPSPAFASSSSTAATPSVSPAAPPLQTAAATPSSSPLPAVPSSPFGLLLPRPPLLPSAALNDASAGTERWTERVATGSPRASPAETTAPTAAKKATWPPAPPRLGQATAPIESAGGPPEVAPAKKDGSWPPRPPLIGAAAAHPVPPTAVVEGLTEKRASVWPPRPPRLPVNGSIYGSFPSVAEGPAPPTTAAVYNKLAAREREIDEEDGHPVEQSTEADERRRERNKHKRGAKRKREAERKESERRAKAELKRQKGREWVRRNQERTKREEGQQQQQQMRAGAERQRLEEAERLRMEEERARPLLRLMHSLDPAAADLGPQPPMSTTLGTTGGDHGRKRRANGDREEEGQERKRRRPRKLSAAKQREMEERRQREARKREKPKVVCKFFINGACKRDDCPFSHDAVPIKKAELCRFFKTGMCLKGDDCLYSHDLKTVPCKFFCLYSKCQHSDEECRFSHVVPRDEAIAYFEKEKQEKEEEERKRKEKEDRTEELDVVPPADGQPIVLPFGISFVRKEDPQQDGEVEADHIAQAGKDGPGEDENEASDDDEDEYDDEDDDDDDNDGESRRLEELLPFGLSASSFSTLRPTVTVADADDEVDLSFPAYAP